MNSAIRAAGLSEFAAVCAQRQAHRNGGVVVALPSPFRGAALCGYLPRSWL